MRSGSKPRPFFNSRRGYIFGYEANLPIDYDLRLRYKLRQPRSLRACSRDDPECGARRGVLRRAARNRSSREARDPARQALRPGCEELAARIRRQMPAVVGRRAPKETEARPRGPKPPRWSAERRASRVMGRKAPR